MKRKASLIAASVTAFTLVMLGSVAYAYRVLAAPRPMLALPSAALPVADRPSSPYSGPQSQISARDAASVASTLLPGESAYSVELSAWNGTTAFKVTFSSGDVVYVGLDGRFLASVPFTSNISYTGGGGGGGGGRWQSGGGSGSSGTQYHEDDGASEHEVEHQEPDEPQEPAETH